LADHRFVHSMDHAQRKVSVVEVEVVDLSVAVDGGRLHLTSQVQEAEEGSAEVRRCLACLVAVLKVALAWRRPEALFQIHLAGSTKNRTDWISDKYSVSTTLAGISQGLSSTAQSQ